MVSLEKVKKTTLTVRYEIRLLIPRTHQASNPTNMNILRVFASLIATLTCFSATAQDSAGNTTGGVTVIAPTNDTRHPLVFLFEAEPRAAEEGPKSGNLMVVRGGDTNDNLTVSYAVSGSAQNEVDYQPLLGRVVIPAGSYLAPIVVTPIDDAIGEERETVIVHLTSPINPATGDGTTNQNENSYRVGWPARGMVTIQDNDGGVNQPPTVGMVSPPDGAVFRGPLDLHMAAFADDRDGNVVTVEFFAGTISLGIASNVFVAFDPATDAATANSFANGANADFDPNQTGVAGTSPILPPVIPFGLAWSNAPPGEHTIRAVATDNQGATTESTPVHIKIEQDTSLPKIEIFARDPVAAEGDTTAGAVNTATFVILRSGNATAELDLQLNVSGTATIGSDYNGVATSVRMPSGQRRTEITIIPIDDSEEEPVETIRLSLLPVGCIDIFPPPPGCFELGRNTNATAWIRDNDRVETNRPPEVHILQPHDNSVTIEPDQLLITANARDNDGHVVSVEFFDGQESLGVVSNSPTLLTDVAAGANVIFLPPWHLNWTNISPGIHVLRAQATDNDGAQSYSRPVEIRVVPSNSIPIVEIMAIDATAAEPGDGNGIALPGTGTTGGSNSGSTATDPNGVSMTTGGSLIADFGLPATDPANGAPTVLNTAQFRITRTGPTNDSLRVSYHIGGSARNGHDYREIPRHVEIPTGARSAIIDILPFDDNHAEGPENILLVLTAPSFDGVVNGLPVPPPPNVNPYIIGAHGRAEAIIHDNDGSTENRPPMVQLLRPIDGSILHSGKNVGIMAHAVDVDGYFTLIEAFANGTKIAEESFAFIQAPRPGSRGTFTLVWSNALAGSYQVRVRVTDNDGARTLSEPAAIQVVDLPDRAVVGVTAADPNAREMPNVTSAADVDPGMFLFHRRGGNITEPMTVHYTLSGSARNGKDYHELSGQVIFAAAELEKRVIVMPIDDDQVERAEAVTVRISPAICPAIFPPPANCYLVGEQGHATVVIRDNDEARNQAPRVVVVSPRPQQRFTAPADIEIEVHTRDHDGWVSQLEFFAGNNKLGDSVIHFIQPPEPDIRQRFSLNWTNVAPGEYTIRARATDNLGANTWSDPVPVRVRDTNAVPIVNIFAKDSRAREGTDTNGSINTATFLVTRTGNTNEDLTLFFEFAGRAQNGTDYVQVPNTIILPAGATSLPLTITPIDDSEVERPESVRLTLVIPPNVLLANGYEFGLHRRAAAVILDNDQTITPPIPGTPNRPAADKLDDGVVHVILTGQEGVDVIVETSENLVDWFELFRGKLVDGQIDLVDIESLEKRLKYYRIIPVGSEAAAVAAQRVF